jgi:hypothetical protein
VRSKALDIKQDVQKLHIISDPKIHYDLLRFCQHTTYGLTTAGKTELLLFLKIRTTDKRNTSRNATETILNCGGLCCILPSVFRVTNHPVLAPFAQEPVALHRLQADGMPPGQRGQR